MKNKTGYRLDHENQKIIVTKPFAKEAETNDTVAYKVLMKLKAENPSYSVKVREIAKKADKTTYKKLSYDVMRSIIKEIEPDYLETLEELISAARGGFGTSYGTVKSWFLKRYPNYNNLSN